MVHHERPVSLRNQSFFFRSWIDSAPARGCGSVRLMNGPTTPAVFAMRTSAFNDFLYAPVGEEENGMVLTALSALARLGVDPWAEAARLSALPRDAATKRLSAIISGSSHGQWAASAVNDIAAR